jgi:hypothetical protein
VHQTSLVAHLGPPAERGQYLQSIVLLFYVKAGMVGRIPLPRCGLAPLTEALLPGTKVLLGVGRTAYVVRHSDAVGFTTRARDHRPCARRATPTARPAG